jgi:hypothetical protein
MANTTNPISRWAVSNHAAKHLSFDDAAVRNVIEQEAKRQKLNIETATRRLITSQSYMKLAIEKAHDALTQGQVLVEPRDAVKIIEAQARLATDSSVIELEDVKRQFQSFMTAIKEIIPEEYFDKIITRAHEIYGVDTIESEAYAEPNQISESSEENVERLPDPEPSISPGNSEVSEG